MNEFLRAVALCQATFLIGVAAVVIWLYVRDIRKWHIFGMTVSYVILVIMTAEPFTRARIDLWTWRHQVTLIAYALGDVYLILLLWWRLRYGLWRLTGLRVLVVENDPVTLTFYGRWLKRAGAAILLTTTMADALHELSLDRTDVVLLDLNLSDSDGLATMQALRLYAREVAVVVVTGHVDNETIGGLFNAGASDYLLKPVLDPDLIVKVVHHAALRYRR